MRPLSLDLRERIVAAYEAGEGSHFTIGERFSVSARVVGKLVAQYRELGTLEPQTHLRGRNAPSSGPVPTRRPPRSCCSTTQPSWKPLAPWPDASWTKVA